jgi:hypothetical protein
MDAENLPEPDALSHRPDHLARRDRFVQRHFAGVMESIAVGCGAP